MSNEEQEPRHPGQGTDPGAPEARHDVEGPGHPEVLDPDDLVLDDGDISAESLEPELSVSADTLDLAEPALEPARISTETAEAASLEAAAAEARAVAAEAEEAGTLVGGPMPEGAPMVQAAPDGTSPAGGVAGDTEADAAPATEVDADAAAESSADVSVDPTATTDADTDTDTDTDTDATMDPTAPDTDTTMDPTAPDTDTTMDPTAPDADAGTHAAAGGADVHHDAIPDGSIPDGAASPISGDDEPVGGPYAFEPEGGEPGLGHPGLYPGTDPAAVDIRRPGSNSAAQAGGGKDGDASARSASVPTAPGTDPAAGSHPVRDRTRAKSSSAPLLLIVGGVVVLLALLIWLLVSLFGSSDDEDAVDPSSVSAGGCLAGFTAITEDAVLVDCDEPHNAQLVASETYPDDAEFPGRDQLGLRAEAACAAASANIDPDVVTDDLRVTLLRATPTEGTWADGDRRVDCFAVVEDGETVSRSLLNS